MKPRKRICKGWDLLTGAERNPDSNYITKEEYEEALAAARAQKECQWHSRSPGASAPAGPHPHCPAEEAGGGGPGQDERPGISSCVRAIHPFN